MTTGELVSFLAIARGSAGEVRSMVAVVKGRGKLARHGAKLEEIGNLADSCERQLNVWSMAVENGKFTGKRRVGRAKEPFAAAREYRVKWLKGLKPEHPLFNSTEAREARGEVVE